MKRKKGIPFRDIEKPMYDKPQSRAVTPPRVAARLSPQVKRMRVRSKKNSLGGKK